MNAPATPAVPDYGAPATRPPTLLLSAEEIAFYRKNGYLAINAIMPAEEIAQVRQIYDRLFNEDRARTGPDTYDLSGQKGQGRKEAIPQILQPAKYAPALLETHARLGALLALVFRHGPRARFHVVLAPDNLDAATRRQLLLLLARAGIAHAA